jgi:hypothetical protein
VARIEHCPAAGEHKIRSGGRQPAVARKRIGGHERCLRTGTLAHHGWLTPAALDCKRDAVAEVRFLPVQRLRSPRLAYASRSRQPRSPRLAYAIARCSFAAKAPWTNAHSQEQRASACRGSVNRALSRENRTLSSGWRAQASGAAMDTSGWRTFTGAAGVSPPWLGERDAVPRESNIVQRLASTRSGAAGVSPPWLGNVLAVMNAVCERERSPTTAGLRQPLLIASGTPLQKCVSRRCNGCVHHGWLTPAALGARSGAAGVQPAVARGNAFAWAIPQTCKKLLPLGWQTSLPSWSLCKRLHTHDAVQYCQTSLPSRSVAQPRGAYAPAPGCTCVCTSQKSPFHRHTFRPHQERGSDAGGDVAANNVLRFESGGH